ncbi:MAG: hypothetical protein H7Z43_03960 [Clostridia bacterium]|nr:hypothetical protein [Deltaproteobacteria bacterium]
MPRVNPVSSQDDVQDVSPEVAVGKSKVNKARVSRHAQLALNAAVMTAARGAGLNVSLIAAIMKGVIIPRQNAETMYQEQHSTPGTRTPKVPTEQSDGTNKTINQFAYRVRLGSRGRLLSQAGCALAAIIMGSNRVTGSNRSLTEANDELTNSGAILPSGAINFRAAASKLGVTQLSRREVSDENMANAQEQLREKGRFLIVGVDYKTNKRGEQSSVASGVDHYIMLDRVNDDGTMSGIDSAGGDPVTFKQIDGQWRSVDASKNYKIREVGVYAASDSVPRSPTIPLRA